MRFSGIWALLFLCTPHLFSQQFARPESIEFDQRGERYLVTNKGEGDEVPSILSVDMEGENPAFFAKTGNAVPNAIEILGDTVYVATELPAILGFDRKTGEKVLEWIIPGTQLLNGLSSDSKGNLYVSDTKLDDVFHVDIISGTATLLASDGFSVNGIKADEANNRLLLFG